MAFDKIEIKQIEKIVEGTEKKLRQEIKGAAETTKLELRKEIKDTVESAKKEIVTTLSREITDLAEINHAVIERVDQIGKLEQRIVRLETIVLK